MCGAFVNTEGEWERISFLKWYKKLFLECIKRELNRELKFYYDICDKCQRGV